MAVETELHALLEEERKEAYQDAFKVQRFRDYTAGKQRITLSEEQREILKGLLKNDFCDNVSRRIVSTVAARVRVDRMAAADTSVEDFLHEVWTKNWLRQLCNRLVYTAVRDGDVYATVGWDNVKNRCTIQRELMWNGKRGMFMAYDGASDQAYAVKEWRATVYKDGKISKVKRRVVYYPERIGRFVERGNGWEWYTLEEQTDSQGNVIREAETADWQPWTTTGQVGGEPLGIPVVQFSRMEQPSDLDNDATGASDNYGVSILDGGVLGIQDAINDDHFSILGAARMTAYQIVTATGVSLIDPATGDEVDLKATPGAVLHSENPAARFGILQPGSMTELVNTLKTHHEAASRSTNTPVHTITGDWPSGEALIQADRPLVDQAKSLAGSLGPAFASIANKCVRISNAFGGTTLSVDTLIKTIFMSPDRDDALSLSTIATAVAPHVSNKEVLRILRYTPEEVEQITKERREEASYLIGQMEAEAQATAPELPPGKAPAAKAKAKPKPEAK